MRRIQKLVTAPTVKPITLTEAKAHLRVTFSDDNTYINGLISAATLKAEQILQRKLITQTWKMFLQRFPAGNYIPILFGDLSSITHLKYTDIDDDQTTFSATDYYQADTNSVPGRLVLRYNESWPTDQLSPLNPIEIQFVTGYGAAATNVPDDIRHAILLIISHYYDVREPVVIGTIAQEVPQSIMSLLYNHRVWKWIF